MRKNIENKIQIYLNIIKKTIKIILIYIKLKGQRKNHCLQKEKLIKWMKNAVVLFFKNFFIL